MVCEADKFLGVVTIEDLLFAAADAKVESLMDRGARLSGLASTKRLPHGARFDMENLLWLSLIHRATSWESFRLTGWSRYSCRSMKKTCLALVAF